MIFSHAFAGAALTRLLHKTSKQNFSKKQLNLIYFVGISAAILPDLDLIFVLINSNLSHRDLLTHSAIPYFVITIVVWMLAKLKKNELFKFLALVFFAGVLSHLILDLFAGAVVLFLPLSSAKVGFPIQDFPEISALWAKTYLASKYMLMETFLTVCYLLTVKSYKNVVLIYLPLFLFAVSVIMFLTMFF